MACHSLALSFSDDDGLNDGRLSKILFFFTDGDKSTTDWHYILWERKLNVSEEKMLPKMLFKEQGVKIRG